MTPEERVRAGGIALVFDVANVPTKRLFALAKAAKLRVDGIRLIVPVTAHVEKVLDLRQAKGARYDAAVVRNALEDAGVEMRPFDAQAAESLAERLCEWFPTVDDWQDAKWRRLHGDEPRGTSKAAATIDWYTAASCPRDAVVVTDDRGAEYRKCDTIGSETLERVLRELAP